MKKAVIIVAGGSGLRMQTDMPKQFISLGTKPILQHTIQKFYDFDNTIKIILVLPEIYIDFWKQLCKENNFSIDSEIVKGGSERFYSVKNAIDILQDIDLVAIHDGVRPFVTNQTIETAFEIANQKGNAIPCISAFDSVRLIENNTNKPINRNNIKIIQTPQVFKFEILKKAYNQQYNSNFTDDASVVEQFGESINLTEGNRTNIKITTSEDLTIAQAFLNII